MLRKANTIKYRR